MASAGITLKFYDAAFNLISSTSSIGTFGTSYQKTTVSATATGTAVYLAASLDAFSVTGTLYFDDCYVRRVVTSEIVNVPATRSGPNGSLGVNAPRPATSNAAIPP